MYNVPEGSFGKKELNGEGSFEWYGDTNGEQGGTTGNMDKLQLVYHLSNFTLLLKWLSEGLGLQRDRPPKKKASTGPRAEKPRLAKGAEQENLPTAPAFPGSRPGTLERG